MLPGFRFLFAAIVLSISTLVFGLGAAALLRASHEQFASLPAMPSAPALSPPVTADASPHDTAPPTLALLQVDMPELDAAATPSAVPAPVIDHAAPASEAKEEVTAPDHTVSESKPAIPAAAATTSEPPKTTETATTPEITSPAVETPSAAAPQQAETIVLQPETPRLEPAASPMDIAKAEPVQAQPVEAQPAQAEAIKQAEPVQPEPAKSERVSVSAAATAPVESARPAPLVPADAPIKTAMLAPTEPAPSAIPNPAVAIAGPIPLPRSREWALAQGHAAQRAAKAHKLAATRARPRPFVRQQIRPQVQAPASAPNPFFPFGQ
ncbi:hypothetical protein ACWX0K_22360 [Nitrobacteraceae bacterium UC4446_H13]